MFSFFGEGVDNPGGDADPQETRQQLLRRIEELSQVYGVSRERVRQIEVRAFEKLQKAMMRLAGDRRLLPAT